MTASTDANPSDTAPVDLVTVTIDGSEVSVPKGTLVIRAAELTGTQIPRFCDHPLLEPVGACRQCLVEVEGQRKPLASCTITVTEGMVIRTQVTSPSAEKAQRGVMELLLINHPLDCPVCDKGGECPLQNQALSSGRAETRFVEEKRTYPKPIPLSSEVLLDRERCVLCARCTRFSQQIAGDPFIELLERGSLQQVGIYGNEPFESYFSGNTVQICPVGALTNTAYRFRARPYDLVSSPSVCEHCASGCAQRTDHRRGKVLRRLAGDDPQVNEEWNCDKGRWAFMYATERDRIESPLIRDSSGQLVRASWSEAITVAAQGLSSAIGRTAVLVGGRTTVEDAYAYGKFARTVLGSDDVDFRVRDHSAEESAFLAAHVAGRGMDVTFDDVEKAPVVLLVAFEPEEESPIVYLRLRKAMRKNGLHVYSIAPYATRGLDKMSGTLVQTVPGDEPRALAALHVGDFGLEDLAVALREPGALILVGERASSIPGTLSAAAALAAESGAGLAWIPRRAGERGAIEAGALAGLLPGGRSITDDDARAELVELWGVDLPNAAGRDTSGILAAARAGELSALVVGGVDPADLPDPVGAREALAAAPFVVSLELRHSEVTDIADVVFPVASVTGKAGTFLNWEGRRREFDAAIQSPAVMSDSRVLTAIAAEMGAGLGLPDAAAARREMATLGSWGGRRGALPDTAALQRRTPGAGEAILSTWRMLVDEGSLQDGEVDLAGTARTPLVRMCDETAAAIGAADGGPVTVRTDAGVITLPLEVTRMPVGVVWVPMNSPGSAVYSALGVTAGSIVRIGSGEPS